MYNVYAKYGQLKGEIAKSDICTELYEKLIILDVNSKPDKGEVILYKAHSMC